MTSNRNIFDHTDPTPLSPKHALQLFLDHNGSVADIVATGVPLEGILAATTDPAFQQQLQDILSVAETGLKLRAMSARHTCIQTLQALSKSTDDPQEQLRISRALLRAATAPVIPRLTRPARGTPAGDHPAKTTPSWQPPAELTPEQITKVVLLAAIEPDDPVPDNGYATIAAFLTDDAAINNQHFDDTTPQAPADAHTPAGDTDPAPELAASRAPRQHRRHAIKLAQQAALKAALGELRIANRTWLPTEPTLAETIASFTIGFGTPNGEHHLHLALARTTGAVWQITSVATHPADSS